jgi:hypothetical protein
MAQISKAVRDAVITRLADPADGLNARFAAIASDYGITDPTRQSIDFAPNSKQFYRGYLGPDDIDDTSPAKYPIAVLFSTGASNENSQKFSLFSGTLTLGLDIHITWRKANAIQNFEDLGDAFEDAVISLFNDPTWAASYGAPIAYNGQISLQKTPLVLLGENWRQSLLFRLVFEVGTN